MNKDILQRAIEKALANGWDSDFRYGYGEYYHLDDDLLRWYCSLAGTEDEDVSVYEIIFNHEFAKSLWPGNSKVVTFELNEQNETIGTPVPNWQYHLQNMVISENPIEYLGTNI